MRQASNTQLVQEAIQRFLMSSTAEVLCIRGKWGVGKTYLWQKELASARESGAVALPRDAYVSLFGVSSLEGLKLSIFENTPVMQPQSKVREFLNSGTRAAKANVQLFTALPYVGKALASAGPLFFATIRNQLVCIDDLERRGPSLTVRDVLGLSSFLKEQRECKVCLLLNDEELGEADKQELVMHMEKVIDISLCFEPTPEDSVRIALVNHDRVNETLSSCCVQLGISNIRVIKRIERVVREVSLLLEAFDEKVRNQAIQTLTLVGWAALQPALAPPMDIIRSRSIEAPRNIKKEDATPERIAWHSLLDDYGFTGLDAFDEELLLAFERGFVDSGSIKKLAKELQAKLLASELEGSFEKAWEPYHSSFDADEDQVLNGIYAAFKPSVQTITPGNLDATVRLFKDLKRESQANELLQYYLDHRKPENEEFWDIRNDPFGSVHDPAVKAAFERKMSTNAPELNPRDALRDFSLMRGWTADMIKAVATLTSDDFYHIFKNAKGREGSRLISGALSFGRYTDRTVEMNMILEKAEEALMRIGRESPLNARRITRYGLTVSDFVADRDA